MANFSKEEAKGIMAKVLSYSKADGCEVRLNGVRTGNIRFARNSVSTTGIMRNTTLVVQSYFGKRSGVATVNEFDDASLEKVVRRSEELAQLAPENPEFVAPLESKEYGPSATYIEATDKITPEMRAQAADDCISAAVAGNVVTAGYLEDNSDVTAMMNSKGLFAYNKSTDLNLTVTMRTPDGTGSGWIGRDYNDITKLNTREASKIAIDKAVQSRDAKAIEPGKYTVILEPAASIELIRNMIFGMNARQADEGRSFLSKKGGGTKLGEKMLDERVNLYADPLNTEVPVCPWSPEGLPQKKMDLVRGGVFRNIFYDRYWAQQKNVAPIPFPGNVIMEGGNTSLEEMIKNTKRGIWVTRFWYTNVVDFPSLLCTGLTRDASFYIENGKVKHPVKNFRFNESPLIILNNLEELGKQVRIGSRGFNIGGFGIPPLSFMIPYMKVRDFNFTSLSDAV